MSIDWKRCVLVFLSALVCTLFPGVGRAESIEVLFVAKEATPFSARVRAEIEAMGFELVSSDQLDAQGRSTAKAAAVVVETPPPRRVELWLKNPNHDRLELSTVLESRESQASPGNEATDSIRASEQLRAFFQPLQPKHVETTSVAPPSPAPAVAPPPALSPNTAGTAQNAAVASQHERARFFEELALALPIEPGSVGVDALVRGGYWLTPRWGVGGKLVIPMLASKLRSGENSADVSLALGGAELSLIVVEAHPLRLLTRAALALAWLRASGEASAPYTSGSDSTLAALPSLAAQLEWRATERVSLSLGAELGLAVPELEVVFASQPVAHWARPFGLLSAGVSLGL
ncbi:MAG TPA: hypothetical protein VHM25_10985 [Polyangiaceae bacterium]|jgi:hypothetical protein|nr:hypothetical protein [Polyangiaceae bacterium]